MVAIAASGITRLCTKLIQPRVGVTAQHLAGGSTVVAM